MDLLIKDAAVCLTTPKGLTRIEQTDIGISNGKITEIGPIAAHKARQVFAGKNLTVLPGIIDTQVHFRQPGMTQKEDIESGSASALLGGITAFFEMPNTSPPTTTRQAFEQKIEIANAKSWTHFAFYVGAAHDNLADLSELEKLPGCPGVKLFMGSSTGSLLIADDQSLETVLTNTRRRLVVHAEDQGRLQDRKTLFTGDQYEGHPLFHPQWRDEQTALLATTRLLRLARKTNRKVHVLHITTAEEMQILADHKDVATVEVLPQHLTLHSPDCYHRLGTRAQMNPPIRDIRHQQALWKGIHNGTVTMIGSDHAPHTLEEKALPWPQSPSGMPGTETLLPLMLHHSHQGRLSLVKIAELCAQNPAKVFGILGKGFISPGMDADLTLVDLKSQVTLGKGHSRCGWSPFEGMKVTGFPVGVVLNGQFAMQEQTIIEGPKGKQLLFR